MIRHIQGTLEPQIWVGSLRDVEDFEWLKSCRIRVIMNVCNDIDSPMDNYFVYLKWGLDDPKEGLASRNRVAAAAELLKMGVNMAEGLRGGIVVHCAAGHNRSALVVALYLWTYHQYWCTRPFEEVVKIAGVKDKKNWMVDKGYTW